MLKKIISILLMLMLICQISVFAHTAEDYKGLLQTLEALDWSGDYPMDSLLSRAQFTKMAVMLSAKRDSVAASMSVSPFKDVVHTYWGTPYIHVAVTNGYVNGYKDGTFRPEDPATYEDAITITLRLLGYTNDDFGSSWPYGQLGTAKQIGLSDNLNPEIGSYITRGDAIMLFYNMLDTVPKGGNGKYIESLGYNISDDISIISSSKTDMSLGAERVYTSGGTFKTNSYFDEGIVGLKGTVVTKDNELILFYPSTDSLTATESYTVYAPLANDILVYKNGAISGLGISMDTVAYVNGQKTTLRAAAQSVDIGYVINISRDTDNTIDYVTIESKTLSGPYVATETLLAGYQNAETFIRDGVKAAYADLKTNDVIYYSDALKTVWAYSKKITGIYESASPNKDTPTSVTISGKTYTLEGAESYNALSSAGTFNYGDTITVLLGRNGDVAGVITPSAQNDDTAQAIGYVLSSGTKEFTNSEGNTYSSLYVSVAQTDGKTYEYTTASNYSTLENAVVKIKFSGDKALLTKISPQETLSGKVSYENMTIGKDNMAKDIEILDISSTYQNDPALFASVFPQRLDGLTLPKGSIYYYEMNDAGEISKLVLKNYTGDMYDYGIVTKAEVSSNRNSASYTYNIGANSSTVNSSTLYSVESGEAARFVFDNNQLDMITPLELVSANASDITQTTIKANGRTYKLSDRVVIYERKISTTYNYLTMPISDLIKNASDYTIKAYADKDSTSGGRVRVLLVTAK